MANEKKREPISKAVDPGAVSQLGCTTEKKPDQLYVGRGYEAPKTNTDIHDCGSQGKH